MNAEVIFDGYKEVVQTIYSPKEYYSRVLQFLRICKPIHKSVFQIHITHFVALLKSVVLLGVVAKERVLY